MYKTDLASYHIALEKMRAIENEIYATTCSQFIIDSVQFGIELIERAIETLRDNSLTHNNELDYLNTAHISTVLDIINPTLTKDINVLERTIAIFNELQQPASAK